MTEISASPPKSRIRALGIGLLSALVAVSGVLFAPIAATAAPQGDLAAQVTQVTPETSLTVQATGTGMEDGTVYAAVIEEGALDALNSFQYLAFATPFPEIVNGNADITFSLPVADLDRNTDYEVIVWIAHESANDDTIRGRAAIDVTPAQWDELFGTESEDGGEGQETGGEEGEEEGGEEEAETADPQLTVQPATELDPTVENELTIEGTGYVGPGAANGVYVMVGEKSIWSGGGPLVANGWIDLAHVSPDKITDGAFSATLTIPADTLDPDVEYHVATSAAHQLSVTNRTLDAFADIAVATSEGETPEEADEPTLLVNGEEDASVSQGDDVEFSLSPVEEGASYTVTVHSDPIELSDPAVANAEGVAAASWSVPADFETGTHTVVFESASGERYESSFEVTEASAGAAGDGSDDESAAAGSRSGNSLATTGAAGPEAIAALAVLALLAGAGLIATRRRQAVRS